MESRKILLMNLSTGREWRCRHREGTVDTVEEGASRMNGEGSLDICTLPSVKWIAGEKLLYNREPGLAHCDDLEGMG